MINVVIVAILVIIIGSALRYIIRQKKKGVKCIGCPEGCRACSTHGAADTNCSCHSKTD